MLRSPSTEVHNLRMKDSQGRAVIGKRVVLRVIQRKRRLVVPPPKDESKWSYGIPGARISEAPAGWQVVELPGEYYQIQKAKGDDIFAILKAFGMVLKQHLYTRGEIRISRDQFLNCTHVPHNAGFQPS